MKVIHLLQESLCPWVSYCLHPSVRRIYTAVMVWIWQIPPQAHVFKCLAPFGQLWTLWDCGSLRAELEGSIYFWFWYKLSAPGSTKMWTSNGCELTARQGCSSCHALLVIVAIVDCAPETVKKNKPVLSKPCCILTPAAGDRAASDTVSSPPWQTVPWEPKEALFP